MANFDNPMSVQLAQAMMDTNGKQKVSQSQNIYDADFEYGLQPLRWETFTYNTTYGQNSTSTSNTATVLALPGLGGVQMQCASAGDINVRQSRPYHRYQPGKSLYMASNINFGGPIPGMQQRVGIFDDGNGIYFAQLASTPTNPQGMYVGVRSDSQLPTGGVPVDTLISYDSWNGGRLTGNTIAASLDWTKVQMIFMEYSWYGAGALKWGVIINGLPYVLHLIGTGNSNFTGSPQILPWSRTGNLPVRYEQRSITANTPETFKHFGVSVLVEGQADKQRGFTYSYGLNPANPTVTVTANKVRYPLLSFRLRAMAQQSYTQASPNGAVSSGTTTTLVTGGAFSVSTAILGVVGLTGGNQIATITIQGQSAMPALGSTINVSGVTPSGFNNASAVVTAVTNNTISYANSTSGTGTGGTAVFVPSIIGRMLNYQPQVAGAAATVTISSAATASSSFTGTIAANTSILTVTGVTGTIYNGMTLGTITGGTFSASTAVVITSQLSGTTGGAGTYNLSQNNTGTAATVTAASGAAVTVTTSAAPPVTINDVVTLTGFTSTGGIINGIYPVIAVSGSTFTINTGYGNNPGTITTTSGAVYNQLTARITANTSTTVTFQDVVTALALPVAPTAGCNYTIGLINRGQLLPQSLIINAAATCLVELIASTPTSQVGLAGAAFQAESTLGSVYSNAERDNSAGYVSGGEIVYSFTSPPSGLQTIDLSNFFPVVNNIKGNIPDILTVAITTTTSAAVGVNFICQEAMS